MSLENYIARRITEKIDEHLTCIARRIANKVNEDLEDKVSEALERAVEKELEDYPISNRFKDEIDELLTSTIKDQVNKTINIWND